MKKLLLILLGTLISLPALARDFTYTYEGQTLTYTVLNEETKTCEVAHNSVSGKVVIPSLTKDGDVEYSVTSIGERAFSSCTGLTSVIIPNSVTSIGDYAFNVCTGLTSVEIPNSVTSIGSSAFNYCSGLTSIEVSPENPNYASLDRVLFNKELSTLIKFPEGRTGEYGIPTSVTSIGNDAFIHCSGLTSVEIPNSVTSIGKWAFADCTSLTSIEIPNSVTSIGNRTFAYCSGLTSIEISNTVTSIGEWAFVYCSGLTSIEIPNTVSSIGEWAFAYCSGLTSIEIPTSVTSIGYLAFGWCEALTSVYYGADKPVKGDKGIFTLSIYENATLYMSEKGIVKGRKINPWKNFAKIEVYDSDGIEAIDADIDTDKPCEVYSLSGARMGDTIENLAPGIYIVRQGNAAKKITVK